MLKTTDYGGTWNMLPTGTGFDLYSISFPHEGTGFVSGDMGTIIKTKDSGSTWQMMQSNSGNRLFSIFAVDINKVYAVGAAGTILKTTNGGATFINESCSFNNNFTIYPNPVKDKVCIQRKIKGYEDVLVRLLTMTGQEVLYKTFGNSNQIELTLSGYSKGLYFIIIQAEGKTESYKIIVK
jgi:hypothetical protein